MYSSVYGMKYSCLVEYVDQKCVYKWENGAQTTRSSHICLYGMR